MKKIGFVKAHPAVILGGVIVTVFTWYSNFMGVADIIREIVPDSFYQRPKFVLFYYETGKVVDNEETKVPNDMKLKDFAQEGCSLGFISMKNDDGFFSWLWPDMPHKHLYVFQVNHIENDSTSKTYRLYPKDDTDSSEISDVQKVNMECKRDGPPGKGKLYSLVFPERNEQFHQKNLEPMPNGFQGNNVIQENYFTIEATHGNGNDGKENDKGILTVDKTIVVPPPLQVEVNFSYLPLGHEILEPLSDNSKLKNGDKIFVNFKSPQEEGYAQAFLKEKATGRCALTGPISGSPVKMKKGVKMDFPDFPYEPEKMKEIPNRGLELEKQQPGELTIVFRATREAPKLIPKESDGKESDGSVATENCSTTPTESPKEFIESKTFSYQP